MYIEELWWSKDIKYIRFANSQNKFGYLDIENNFSFINEEDILDFDEIEWTSNEEKVKIINNHLLKDNEDVNNIGYTTDGIIDNFFNWNGVKSKSQEFYKKNNNLTFLTPKYGFDLVQKF